MSEMSRSIEPTPAAVRDAIARGDLAGGEVIDEELGLGEVGRGVDALQNFTETIRLPPFSLMPERPDTVYPATARPTPG